MLRIETLVIFTAAPINHSWWLLRLLIWNRIMVMMMMLVANSVPAIAACPNVFQPFKTFIRQGVTMQFKV